MSSNSSYSSGSTRLRCRRATMRTPLGKSRLSPCAPKLQIASDRMEPLCEFAIIVSGLLGKRRSRPATK